MNTSFGIYDFFVGIIPGAVYLAVGVYVALRFGWVATDDVAELNTALALTGGAVASHLVGQLVAPNLMAWTDRLPWWRTTDDDARATFLRRNPEYGDRPFLRADVHTLLAGIHMVSPTLADRIDRSRATGIMLRSIVPAALIAAAVSLVEAALGAYVVGPVAAVAFTGCALLALKEGRKFGLWSRLATFEAALFVPDIDQRLTPRAETTATGEVAGAGSAADEAVSSRPAPSG